MIKNYDELIKIKEENGGLAIGFGCFDILHYGHLNYVNAVLEKTNLPFAVGVLPDEYVRVTKGENRPVNNEKLRTAKLDEKGAQPYTFLIDEKGDYEYYKNKFNLSGKEVLWQFPINALYRIKPTEFYYSTDFPLTKEILAVFDELHLKHQAISYTEGISSTDLINRMKDNK